MGTDVFDVAVIGGGIAGVTAACHLAESHRVVLLEQEDELAHHTTSRSAAVYIENEGGPVFHRLSTASREFFEADHSELDGPLLTPLGVLKVGGETERAAFEAEVAAANEVTSSIRLIEGDELIAECPVIRPEVVTVGLIEPTAAAIDVMAVHQLFLRRARTANAEIRRSARVTQIDKGDGRAGARWKLLTAVGPVEADIIVNAAGAWGDEVAALAGAEPVGLTPMRRTAFTTATDFDTSGWSMMYSPISKLHCYFKPEAGGQLLCSLADETPSQPCDARPEEIDVAQAIDHINSLTTLNITSVKTTWAGLRTFAPDRNPVFGWDDELEGFFWLVGQGGCGIVTSPAAGQLTGALIRGEALPESIASLGLTEEALAPRRDR